MKLHLRFYERIVNLLLFLSSIFLLIFPILNQTRLSLFYSNGCFYILCLIAACWGYLFLKQERWKLNGMFRRPADLKTALIVSLAFTIAIVLSCRWHFRVLADETNYLSISKNMLEHHQVGNIIMGRWYFYAYHPESSPIDWRPLLYPFVTFIFHTFLGYRATNAFLVNSVLCFLFVFVCYSRMSRWKGRFWALSAIFLIFSNPSFTEMASCAGLDFLSCILTLYCFAIFADYLKNRSESDFKWLWINLVLLANTRLESIFVLIVACFFLLIWKLIDVRWVFRSFTLTISPLLLAPRIWLYFLFSDGAAQGMSFRDPGGGKTWGIHFFLNHTKLFFTKIFDFNFDGMRFSNVTIFIGVIGLLYGMAYFLTRKEMQKTVEFKMGLFLISVLGSMWVIITSFYMSAVDLIISSRYYGVYFVMLSFSAVWLLTRISWINNNRQFLLAFSILVFAVYHPVTVTNSITYYIHWARELRFSLDFFLDKRKQDVTWNPIIISPRPNMYVPFNFSALNTDVASREKWDIKRCLDQGLATDVYVLQEIEFKTLKPTADSVLDSSYHTMPVREVFVSPDFFMRISHVEKIDVPGTT